MVTESLKTLRAHVIEALCKSLDDLTLSKSNLINVGNLAIFALRCTIKILDQGIQKVDQAMERALSSIILTLLKIAQNLPLLSQMITKHLYPLAVGSIKQGKLLQQNLQVSFMFSFSGL